MPSMVGAFSAFNGVGSASPENLPFILVSGAPNINDVGQHLLHHTLGDYDLTYQLEMAKKITCCAVRIRRAAHAPELIDRAIRNALVQRKPVYIEVPTNLAGEGMCPAWTHQRRSCANLKRRPEAGCCCKKGF